MVSVKASDPQKAGKGHGETVKEALGGGPPLPMSMVYSHPETTIVASRSVMTMDASHPGMSAVASHHEIMEVASHLETRTRESHVQATPASTPTERHVRSHTLRPRLSSSMAPPQ